VPTKKVEVLALAVVMGVYTPSSNEGMGTDDGNGCISTMTAMEGYRHHLG